MSKSKKLVLIFGSVVFVFIVYTLVYVVRNNNEYVSFAPKMFGMSVNKAEQIAEQQNLSIITEDNDGNDGITAFDKIVVIESETDIPIPQLIGVSVDNVDSMVRQYDLTYIIED